MGIDVNLNTFGAWKTKHSTADVDTVESAP